MSQIKVISQCYIKPKHTLDPSKNPHHLGPVDLMVLSLGQMQKGLLFQGKPQNIQSNLINNLKKSLSYSLIYFYPLAGKLTTQKFDDEHAIWVYVDCINGPGARLIHATVDLTVHDLISSTDVHPIVGSFFDVGEKGVVNYDGHTRALLTVQVTELIDGVFIGFSMNHSVADGVSLWHFVSSLSEVFSQLKDYDGQKILDSSMNGNISRKPIYNPYYPQGFGPILKLPFLEPDEFVGRFDPGPLRERIFHFSPKAMSMLKIKANEECNHLHNTSTNTITRSSFQALIGLVWKSITRARNLPPNVETICSLAINWRARIKPSFSEDCFGNYIMGAQGICKVDQILGRGIGWAALLVHQSVEAQDDSKVREYIDKFVEAPYVNQTGSRSAYYNPNSVLIAGSPRFDMYGPEFGLGKAVGVLAGYANKADGKITANPGREGNGSVDLEICLKPEIMRALETEIEFMSVVAL